MPFQFYPSILFLFTFLTAIVADTSLTSSRISPENNPQFGDQCHIMLNNNFMTIECQSNVIYQTRTEDISNLTQNSLYSILQQHKINFSDHNMKNMAVGTADDVFYLQEKQKLYIYRFKSWPASDNYMSFKQYIYSKRYPFKSASPKKFGAIKTYLAQIWFLKQRSSYALRVHKLDVDNMDVVIDQVNEDLSQNLYDFALSEIDGKVMLNTIFKDDLSGDIKILTYKEGPSQSFIQTSEIKVNTPNCGTRIVSSKSFFVAACSQSNIITVYDAITNNELCTVNGVADGNLGADLQILDHDDNPNDHETRKFSTIYAAGYVSATNLHYVSQIHIIPDFNAQKIECIYDPKHIVEKTITSPAGGVQSTQAALQVEVAPEKGIVMVLLTIKDPDLSSSDQRSIYHSVTNSFTSSPCVAGTSYKDTTIKTSTCYQCTDAVDDSTHPARSAIKKGTCPTNIGCPSNTQHGSSCQQCDQYMPNIGETLPSNAEWVNGETCSTHCVAGFKTNPLTGQCQDETYVDAVAADSCAQYTNCGDCVLNNCDYDMGSCKSYQFDKHFIKSQALDICGHNLQYCGPEEVQLNFAIKGETVSIRPIGGNDGKKSFKNMICLWNIKFKNRNENNYKFELFYSMLQNSRLPYLKYKINDWSYLTMSTEDDKSTFKSDSVWNYANKLKIGVIFNTESDKDLVNITLRNTSIFPVMNQGSDNGDSESQQPQNSESQNEQPSKDSSENEQPSKDSSENEQPSKDSSESDQPIKGSGESDQSSNGGNVIQYPTNGGRETQKPSESHQPSNKNQNIPNNRDTNNRESEKLSAKNNIIQSIPKSNQQNNQIIIIAITSIILVIVTIIVIVVLIRCCKQNTQYQESKYRSIHHADMQNIPCHQVCPVCLESLEFTNPVVTPCRHYFHKQCITSWLQSKAGCPMCRSGVRVPQVWN